MRILVAHNHYRYPGGEDAVAANEIGMLRSHGHEVLALEADNSSITTPLTAIKAAASVFASRSSYATVGKRLADFQPDVVHIHNWFPLLSPSVIGAANDAGVPVVQTLHNFRMLCANGLLYRNGAICQKCIGKALPLSGIVHACYRDSRTASTVCSAAFAYHRLAGTWTGVSRFIALSEFQRELLLRGGLPESQITIKPNFVPENGTIGQGDGGYFLFVARLTPEKGIRTALRAWLTHPLPLPLRIIGDGPLRDEVIACAGQSHRIQYLGQRTPAEVAAQMADAKALVFASEWYEPFALAIIEAFSHGTPVLASDVESIKDLVQHTSTGRTFEAGSSDALSEQVFSLDASVSKYSRMRRQCRAEYESRYTESANYPQLIAIYERAIREGAPRSASSVSFRGAPVTRIQPATAQKPAVANVVGIPVHAVNMESALDAIACALTNRRKGYVCLAGAHGIIEASRDAGLRNIASQALLVLPDGTPTVWMGRTQGYSNMGRVFGPDLMLEIFRRERFRTITHFFWGGEPGTADRLRTEMQRRYPHAQIVGQDSPPNNEFTKEAKANFIAKIAILKPDIIWVGISTPKQDMLMAEFSPLLETTLMIGVGAAFLFHTGVIQDSPQWVKRAGLQWLHRLVQEPSRLWRRYLSCIPAFSCHCLLQVSGVRAYSLPGKVEADPRSAKVWR